MTRPVILVVEDNLMNFELVKDLLEASDYQVIHSPTANDAIESLKTIVPDLILTDIQLPDLDGYSLIKILKANEKTRNIPMVALTAYAMKGDRQKILETGCDGYISKPINTREFIETVRKFMVNK